MKLQVTRVIGVSIKLNEKTRKYKESELFKYIISRSGSIILIEYCMDKDSKNKFKWLTLSSLLFLVSCVSKVNDPIFMSEPYKELAEYKRISTEGMACDYDFQCNVIAYGYRRCNNFENNADGYIVYSSTLGREHIRRLKYLAELVRDLDIENHNRYVQAYKEGKTDMELICSSSMQKLRQPSCKQNKCI